MLMLYKYRDLAIIVYILIFTFTFLLAKKKKRPIFSPLSFLKMKRFLSMILLLHLLIITSQIVNTEARPLKKPSHEVRLPVEVKIGNHATMFMQEASLGEVFLVPKLCYFSTNYDLLSLTKSYCIAK